MYWCLDRAAELFWLGAFPKLATSGAYAVEYDFAGREPYPWKECDVSAGYLIEEHGVPDGVILREGKSKDTLQNLVELKKLFIQRGIRHILIVAPEHRVERLEWLA